MQAIQLTGCSVDLQRREVRRGDDTHVLSSMENTLLSWFLEHPGEPVSRDTLLVEVWGFPKPVPTRAVDNTVMRLRTKIEVDPKNPDHVVTLRGVGYVFELRVLGRDDGAPVPAPARPPTPSRMPAPSPAPDFFGREADLAALSQAAAEGRLVTVLGPGGVGKTRLIREFSRDRAEALFVDLTAARQAGDVLRQVAGALGVPGGTDAAVLTALRDRPALLILDNIEQVLDPVAELLPGWLRAAPGLRVVCTSRARLRLRDEWLVELGPLPPDSARAMFLHRARMLNAAFEVSDTTSGEAALDAVLDQLDRLPLAIELAAARTRLMSLTQLRDALAESQRVLRSDLRDYPGRHRAMEQTMRWSWELLSPPQQAALATASLMVVGFDLDTFEALLDTGEAGDWPLDLLSQLRDRSLVVADEGFEGDARYTLLETVRQFASDQLAQRADVRAVEDRAAAWFRVRAAEWRRGIHASAPQAAIARLRLERPNLLALARRLAERRPEDAARILYALGWHLLNDAPDPDALRLAVATADRSGDSALRINNRLLLGRSLEWIGRPDESEAVQRRAMALAEESADARHLVPICAFHLAAHQARRLDTAAAIATCERGLEVAREVGGQEAIVPMLHNRMASAYSGGEDFASALPHLEAATAGYEATGQTVSVPYPLLGLALCKRGLGDLDGAEQAARAVLTRCEALGMERLATDASVALVWVALARGDGAEAEALAASIAEAVAKHGDPSRTAWLDLQRSMAAALRGERPDPALLAAAAETFAGLDHARWAAACALMAAWAMALRGERGAWARLVAARETAVAVQSPDLERFTELAGVAVYLAEGAPGAEAAARAAAPTPIGDLTQVGSQLLARLLRDRCPEAP